MEYYTIGKMIFDSGVQRVRNEVIIIAESR